MLMAQGHPEARHYPLWMLWSDATIARNRVTQQMVTEAVVLQTAIGALLGKAGHKAWKDLVKQLTPK
jgi:hypothetical protein